MKLAKSGWIKTVLSDKLTVYKDGEKGNYYTKVQAQNIQRVRDEKAIN